MGDPKPPLVLWSAAGPDIVPVQAKLVEDATDIVSDARGRFLHALPHEGDGACCRCTGYEAPDERRVFVQTALYEPMPPLADDHPDPERRGEAFRLPEVIEGPDDEVFAAYDDVVC